MPNYEELFTRRMGGGKRTYYLDVKQDTNGEKYVVLSESTRKEGDRKMRNRVMVWKEDFEEFFGCLEEMKDFLADEIAKEAERRQREQEEDEAENADSDSDRPPYYETASA